MLPTLDLDRDLSGNTCDLPELLQHTLHYVPELPIVATRKIIDCETAMKRDAS
ncbi:MAG: hypothetical protein PHE57_07120 [Synergistales bacterium]|nr:hypothetical protein [Synergistales bacterium]